MGITIENNTKLLNTLKQLANSLPNKDDVTSDLSQTTAGASNVLSGKTFYYVDSNKVAHYTSGTMSNLGDPTYVVSLTGSTTRSIQGYVNNVTVKFSDDVTNEINTQSSLIAQIKQKLIEKGAHL